MSYLPELRKSLIQAAERQATPVAVPARRRPRWGFGGLALMGASLAAIVAAGVVLVLIGHRNSHVPAPASNQYGSRTVALEAAAQLLSAFRPPAGAVGVAKDPSHPRRLGWVDGGLPAPAAVDLSRFYLMRGDPEAVMSKVDPLHSLGPGFAPVDAGPFAEMYGTSSSSSGTAQSASRPGSAKLRAISSSSATMTMPLRGVGDLARQIVIQTASAGQGMVAMRIDAQAWWTVRRPASERIPSNARAIMIQRLGPLPTAAHLHVPARLIKTSDVRNTIAFLNSVGVVQPLSGGTRCPAARDFRLRLTFTGTGQHPDPVAVINPNCDRVVLTLRGQPQPALMLGSPTGQIDALRGIQLIELLTGTPQTKTWSQLLAQAKQERAASSGSVSSRAPRR